MKVVLFGFAILLIVMPARLLWDWWTWPALDQWFCRNMTLPNSRMHLQMHESAVRRAIRRYNRATGQSVEYLRLARPPLLLYLRRLTWFRSTSWALVNTDSGPKFLFLCGWYLSDSALPELFDAGGVS